MSGQDDKQQSAIESTSHSDNELDRLASRLLDDISGDKATESGDRIGSIMFSEKYRGPFSHPHILKELDQVVTNGAERGFRLTEKEQEFRHERVKELLGSEIKEREKEAFDRRLIIILIFAFLALCLVGAFVAVMTGHNTGAGLVAGAGAVITGGGLLIARIPAKKSKDN
jgi:uncharacterized membrane protein